MDVYMFQGALLCEDCGRKVRAEIDKAGKAPEDPDDEESYDSDDYPRGPYRDGGGEADSPQHCDECGIFLENPLTDDGRESVEEMIATHRKTGRGNAEALKEWSEFYDIPLEADEEEAEENPKRNSEAGDLKREMVDHLHDVFGNEIEEFDIEAAIYWFASDYHGGQWSPLYSILSTSKYSPGRSHRSVEDEGDLAADAYGALERKFSKLAKNGGGVKKNQKENPARGPGKFSSDLDEVLWTMSLDSGGPDEELSGEGFGWYGLLRNLTADEVAKFASDEKTQVSDEELDDVDGASAILFERTDGIVEVDLYDPEEAEKEWAKLEEEFETEAEETEEV